MIPSRINDRWDIVLPQDRHEFHLARPNWESERLASMHERLEDGMNVFDVGAESGDFTALYKLWVGPGEVLPVEPSLPYWPSIRQTWEANGFDAPRFTFTGFASDVTRLITKKEPGESLVHGWPECSVGGISPDFGFRHLAQDTDRTPQVTLDHLAGKTFVPDVIVMDIEGAEYRALKGAQNLLREHKLLVWVSVHPPTMKAWYGKTPADIDRLMWSLGYDGALLAPAGRDGEDYVFYAPRSK